MHKVDADRLNDFLGAMCAGRDAYALTIPPASPPDAAQPQYHLVRIDNWESDKHTGGAYRPVEPLKTLVFPPVESVESVPSSAEGGAKERVVIGVKNCDLSALKIHDYVFLKTEPVDPFYAEARERTILVSFDCTDAREVCFCTAVNEQPHPKEGFDINVAPTDLGCVVEAGSERGKTLLKDLDRYLEPADEAIVRERDRIREEMVQRVSKLAAGKGLAAGMDFQKAIVKTAESELWGDFAEDCVECGACNFACCTCHCFLLADSMSKENVPRRKKKWDSCLYRNFARVAGGANPRGHRAERLQNRFDKKFNFFPEVIGSYGCDGCGRCIEACTGKIDIREVLKKAVDEL